ncbi:MAG: TolC family protein [Lentimicrobium sp.]|nr:TolC family protein [Lentimicrobium sp.]
MKTKILLITLFLFVHVAILAQNPLVISLDSCRKLAVEHNPQAMQSELYRALQQNQTEISQRGYLPQVNLNGQASWQSEVTKVPINIPNLDIPTISRDQYRVNLDFNQLIWDGGAIKSQQQLDISFLEINLQEIEIGNLRISEAVNQTYFSILLYEENEKLLQLAMDEIHSRLAKIRAGVANGIILPTNADMLDVELIRLEQMLTDVRYNKNAAIYRLTELTGLEANTSIEFVQPAFDDVPLWQNWQRPEYKLFALQQNKLEKQRQMVGLKIMPRLSAFSNVGYGKPGLNMLSNNFDPFFIMGIRFNWNVWDWNITEKNRENIDIQKQITHTRQQAWEMNQRILLNNYKQEILKIESQLAADYRIVDLQQSITASAGAQLESGIITSSEYLTEQNAYTRAKLNLGVNKIMLQRAKLNYLTVIGLTN